MKLANILKGIGGDYEIGRVSLAIGGMFAVTSPIAFEWYEVGWNGGHFDVAAWCLAYPGGLVALVAGGVFAIASKDKSVAAAKQTQAATDVAAAAVTGGAA
jgi:hypothetical protein